MMTNITRPIVNIIIIIVSLCIVPTVASAQFGDPPLPPGTREMRTTLELDVPIEVAWNAFTTAEGLRAWTAPKADVDFRIGGLIRTSYDPNADLDGPHAIHQRVLAYEPLRMVSLRTVKAPEGFPHARAITGTWGVTWFESLSPTRTRLTFASMGWMDDPEWDAAWNFFEAGNAMLFDRMRAVFSGELPASLRRAPKPIRSLAHEVIVNASPEEVWHLITTTDGITQWMAPNANINLQLGGSIRTHHDPEADVAGSGAIVHDILTFERDRLIAFRFTAPESAPAAAQRAESCWWMIELQPAEQNNPDATRIRCTMHGFGEGEEWDETYRFFDAGNKWTLDQLAAAINTEAEAPTPPTLTANAITINHPVLRELHRLRGGEWIHESTRPDGSTFLSRNIITAGPDGRSLISRGWLGNETGMFEHGATQVWIEPGTDQVRFQSIDENGGIARGAIALNDAGTIIWEWNQHAANGTITTFDVRMHFTGRDTYEMSITRPGSDDERAILPPVTFHRTSNTPAHFLKQRPAQAANTSRQR